jgi:uncharacterized UBP type Zn finger protein
MDGQAAMEAAVDFIVEMGFTENQAKRALVRFRVYDARWSSETLGLTKGWANERLL